MTLIILAVLVIALLIAVLVNYLFMAGMFLNRIADNLGDCLQSIKSIRHQSEAIRPGIVRLNHIGKELIGALLLLYECAERLVDAKPALPTAIPSGVGYLDV